MVKTIIPSECPDCGLSPKHTFCYREDFVIYGKCFRCDYIEVIQRIEHTIGPEWMNREKLGRPKATVPHALPLGLDDDDPGWDDAVKIIERS